MKRVVVGITGASGAQLGLALVHELAKSCEVYAVMSEGAQNVLQHELGVKFRPNENLGSKISGKNSLMQEKIQANLETILTAKNVKFYTDTNLAAPISSGSFRVDAAIIAPCSINTLAKVACGLTDTLITRAAAVALKEQRRLVLGVREMPLSAISLRQMADLASLGVVIAPPVLGYYANAQSVEQIESFVIGKWLDALGVENEIYKRWQSEI